MPEILSAARLIAVDPGDPRAALLRAELDTDLNERYRSSKPEPAEISAARAEALRVHPEQLVATLIAELDGAPVGHVMLRRLGDDLELKRLVVSPAARGRGIGRALVAATIERAKDAGSSRLILQTGSAQPESLALYRSFGFTPIPVYEPYVATMPNSLCFELAL